jgi:circadian clock protein KaiC
VFVGPHGILVGSAKHAQLLEEEANRELKKYALGRKERDIHRKRAVLEANIASLQQEFESLKDELNHAYEEEEIKLQILNKNRTDMVRKRTLGAGKHKSKK